MSTISSTLMDTKSKILFVFFGALVVCSTLVSYYKYAVRGDITFFQNEDSVPDPFDIVKN